MVLTRKYNAEHIALTTEGERTREELLAAGDVEVAADMDTRVMTLWRQGLVGDDPSLPSGALLDHPGKG